LGIVDTGFLQAVCPLLSPNQQRECAEGVKQEVHTNQIYKYDADTTEEFLYKIVEYFYNCPVSFRSPVAGRSAWNALNLQLLSLLPTVLL